MFYCDPLEPPLKCPPSETDETPGDEGSRHRSLQGTPRPPREARISALPLLNSEGPGETRHPGAAGGSSSSSQAHPEPVSRALWLWFPRELAAARLDLLLVRLTSQRVHAAPCGSLLPYGVPRAPSCCSFCPKSRLVSLSPALAHTLSEHLDPCWGPAPAPGQERRHRAGPRRTRSGQVPFLRRHGQIEEPRRAGTRVSSGRRRARAGVLATGSLKLGQVT